MTEDMLERANDLIAEKRQAEKRIQTLKELQTLNEQTIDFGVVHRINQYSINLTQEDIDVLIDHEEMKLGEYERKFKEL